MTGVSGVSYNGVDLREYGLYTNGNKVFSSPKKNYTKVSVPGRGDLFFWDGTYSNVDVEYSSILLPTPIFNSNSFESKFRNNTIDIKSVLLSAEGYVRIEDTYNPDEFRLGVFEGPLDIDAVLLSAGNATLKFNCKPERFLFSGEEEIALTYSDGFIDRDYVSLSNPTSFISKPLITIKGDGEWTFFFYKLYRESPDVVHRFRFRVDGPEDDSTLYFDSELMDFYLLSSDEITKTNLNSHATILGPPDPTDGRINIQDETCNYYPGTNYLAVMRANYTTEGTAKIKTRVYNL